VEQACLIFALGKKNALFAKERRYSLPQVLLVAASAVMVMENWGLALCVHENAQFAKAKVG